MAKEPPRIGGYTLINPPDTIDVVPEVIQQLNELADGGIRQRILGYRYHATLTWDANWIRQADFTGLMAVANDASASITLIPMPVTFGSVTYVGIWTNKFDFRRWQGRQGTWNGTIDFVTVTPTSTITGVP